MGQNPIPPEGDGAFPTTQWTVIVDAVSTDPGRATKALERLCAVYRQAIVNWFRRKDFYQDPEDLTHSFIAYLIKKSLLHKVAPRTGKFRAFLAATMRNFLRDDWDRNNADKRGGNAEVVSLTDNDLELGGADQADNQMDVDFALVIHKKVMITLAPRPELLPYIFQKDSSESWNEIAAQLGKTSVAVRKEVGRLRRRHWEIFQDEVIQIVTLEFRADETRYLYELLFRNLPQD